MWWRGRQEGGEAVRGGGCWELDFFYVFLRVFICKLVSNCYRNLCWWGLAMLRLNAYAKS